MNNYFSTPPGSSGHGDPSRVTGRPGEKPAVGNYPDHNQRSGHFRPGAGPWGWLPEIALFEALILAGIAWAFVQARAGIPGAEFFFWVGLAAMLAPVAIRVASPAAGRNERLALVVLLGMAFYLVKVMHSPAAFTFPDELTHMRNVREVLESGRLFQENPVQPTTSFYPGLPAVTSLLASLSGLSVFASGILVIGAARLVLFVSLFLLYERISGSSRVAGLSTLFYMANPNFLYWTAQYAYESLALPIAILVLYAVVKRESASAQDYRWPWTVTALLGVLLVVTTHHMTSYILAALLAVMAISMTVQSRGKRWGPWDLALVALGASAFWTLVVSSSTVQYLSWVVEKTTRSIVQIITMQERGRELFKSSATGYEAPLWEKVNGLASVALIMLGLPFGASAVWQRYRRNIFALLLAAIALLYLPVQLLRLTRGGWEAANRSSEFLFIGIGFVLAVGLEKFWFARRAGQVSRTALAGFLIVLFFGGLIAGWPPKGRLPRPYVVSANGHLVSPPSVAVAEWMLETLGPDNRVAASKADAKIIGAYDQEPFTGASGGIQDMFFSDVLGYTGRNSLRKRSIQYVVLNRRMVSWDHMIGFYFFKTQASETWELETIAPEKQEKFDELQHVNRILDSGDIVVYDVGIYLHTPMEQRKTEQPSPTSQKSLAPVAEIPTAAAPAATPGLIQPAQLQKGGESAAGSDLPGNNPPGAASTAAAPALIPLPVQPVAYSGRCAIVPAGGRVEYVPGSSDTLVRVVLGRNTAAGETIQVNCLGGRGLTIERLLWLPFQFEIEVEQYP